MSARPFNRRRIHQEAALISDLRYLGAVDLDKPSRRFGFEQRLERADSRPRTGEGGYIGDRAEQWSDHDERTS